MHDSRQCGEENCARAMITMRGKMVLAVYTEPHDSELAMPKICIGICRLKIPLVH